MDRRLRAARRDVDDLARLARSNLASSGGTVVGEEALAGETVLGDASPRAQRGGFDFDDDFDDDDDEDLRAGTDAGLALFGTSSDYLKSVEDEFRKRLDRIEEEVEAARSGLAAGLSAGDDGEPGADEGDDGIDDGKEGIDFRNDDVVDEDALLRRITLLRRCADVRSSLDEAEDLSSRSPRPSDRRGFDFPRAVGSAEFQSPSSISCGPGDFAKFAFDSPSSSGGDDDDGSSPPVVRAAVAATKARKILDEASDDAAAAGPGDAAGDDVLAVLDELRRRALRKSAELRRRAASTIEGCVVVEGGGLTVRGARSAPSRGGAGGGEAAFRAAESPIATSSPGSDGGGASAAAGSPLADAYAVLDALSIERSPGCGETAEGRVRRTADDLVERALRPGLKELEAAGGRYEFREEVVKGGRGERAKGPAARLGWTLVRGEGAGGGVATFEASLGFVERVLSFFCDQALVGRKDLAGALGRRLFGGGDGRGRGGFGGRFGVGGEDVGAGGLATLLAESLRENCVPSADDGSDPWRALREAEARAIPTAEAFEEEMVRLGLTGAAEGAEEAAVAVPSSSLSDQARALRSAYVEGRRARILARCRSILLDTDPHDTVRVGTCVPEPADPSEAPWPTSSVEDAFALHRCSASKTARKVMELCRTTLDEAVAGRAGGAEGGEGSDEGGGGSDPAAPLRTALYRASREVLDLFRAVVPASRATEVATLPRAAAVLHNDACYLAKECLLLGVEYKSKFRELRPSSEESGSLGEACSFVDMVPPFRELATKSMGSMIEMQKGQLRELVAPRLSDFRRALASNESVAKWDDADTALCATLHHLPHLSQTWRRVLSCRVYHLSMGNLVDTIFVLFLDPVLAAATRYSRLRTSPSPRPGLSTRCSQTQRGDWPRRSLRTATRGRTTTRLGLAKRYSVDFDQTRAVGGFMRMRLDEVERGLEEGAFGSATARELLHLIVAAFDDSEKRRSLLNALVSK
ncbi:hypothetical protein ACHAWF_010556 [Thalassiosira exigua]